MMSLVKKCFIAAYFISRTAKNNYENGDGTISIQHWQELSEALESLEE